MSDDRTPSSGSPARRPASAPRWFAHVRGPTPRSSACSRREHPDHETVQFDMTDMDSWYQVGEHLTERLATFRGERSSLAIIIQLYRLRSSINVDEARELNG